MEAGSARTGERSMEGEQVEEQFIAAAKASTLVWLAEPSGRYRVHAPAIRAALHVDRIGGARDRGEA